MPDVQHTYCLLCCGKLHRDDAAGSLCRRCAAEIVATPTDHWMQSVQLQGSVDRYGMVCDSERLTFATRVLLGLLFVVACAVVFVD